jgi:hypothetical protein
VLPPDVIVKFESEISKNTFPTASTFIRPVAVEMLGISRDSEPSFAVLADSTVGKVLPPSVDNVIFTLPQLIGEAEVFATFHEIV